MENYVNSLTYVINSVNEGVIATVAHSQPVKTEPNDVDIAITVDFGEDFL